MAMDLMKELMKKKKAQGDMDPMYKKAKMGMLEQVHKLASDALGDDVKGLKQVTVAAPDKEGLAEGLDKAKQLASGQDEEDESDEQDDKKPDAEDMIEQQIDHEADEGDLSSDEIDELIQALELKKQALKK